MGSTLITEAPMDNYRIERTMKNFDIPPDKIQILWNIFCRFDKDRSGDMSVDDFFQKYLKIRRSRVGNAMFDLLDVNITEDKLKFEEFVEVTCTFACMEQLDLVKFVFYALDSFKTGTVDKNELKYFVYDMWDNQVASNITTGLAYLDSHDNNGDGRFLFKQVYEMHVQCPSLFYPTFRLQQAIMRYSFGTIYWEWHKRYLIEGQEERKMKELKKLRREKQLKDSRVSDEMVQNRMGIGWYLFPWLRQNVRERLIKIATITAELDAIANEDQTVESAAAVTTKPTANTKTKSTSTVAIAPSVQQTVDH